MLVHRLLLFVLCSVLLGFILTQGSAVSGLPHSLRKWCTTQHAGLTNQQRSIPQCNMVFVCFPVVLPEASWLVYIQEEIKQIVVFPCGNRSSNVCFPDCNGLRLVGKQNTASCPQPRVISVRGCRTRLGAVTWLGISSAHSMAEWHVKAQRRPIHNWWCVWELSYTV